MNCKKLIFIILFLSAIIFSANAQNNNITITDETNHDADPSAVLDIYSTSKGILVPRMATVQINAISSPANGLLVFNTDSGVNSFWFFDGTNWVDLSSGSGTLWSVGTGNNIYLNNTYNNVGIGTNSPASKLTVQAPSGAADDELLFVIQNEQGEPIFSVTPTGVRIYIKDDAKGQSGGFAVGRYGIAKGMEEYLRVTADSTRVSSQAGTKAQSGGFAVGRYGIAKDIPNTIFHTDIDSTRIYTKIQGKGQSGGFAVGRYGLAKGTENYLHLTKENYSIGHNAGISLTNGLNNVFLGYEAGMMTAGDNPDDGSNNVFIGFNSGHVNHRGHENVFLGHQSGIGNTTGSQNVFVGTNAGFKNTIGFQNIFVGNSSGYGNIDGENNLFIGENAGYNNQSGESNISIGNSAGYMNNNNQNIFIGGGSFRMNATGSQNVILGLNSGYYNDTGSGNVFIGVASGNLNKGSDNVFIGKYAGHDEIGSNKLYIENSNTNSSEAFIYGEFDNNYLNFNVNTGGVEGKVNINNVLRLQPRSSAPLNPEEGDLYVGTDFHIYCYLNSTWVQLD